MRRLNIAVAGCGPGGMAAALLLARDGHWVTIFERFATPLPIGSGLILQPTGRAVLRSLGLVERVENHGARIERLFGTTGSGGRTVLDVRYATLGKAHGYGTGIHRASLFAVLNDAVTRQGIPVAGGRAIGGSSAAGSGRLLEFVDGSRSGPFDLVVDALGTRSALAATAGRALAYGALWASLCWPAGGFDPLALEQRYRAASVMAGVLPIGTPPDATSAKAAFFWSLRADRLSSWKAAGLRHWKDEVEALWPATRVLLEQIEDEAQLTFAHYAHRTLREPGGRALIHIGDSWHSASPQLGQGANMALLDAYALAVAVRESTDVADAIQRAVAMRRLHVRLYQAMSAAFTPFYQSDSRLLPVIRDLLVGPLAKRWPVTTLLASMVAGTFGRPLAPLRLDP